MSLLLPQRDGRVFPEATLEESGDASDPAHGHESAKGVLLINLGTPEAPTPEAVRPYLSEFLSDPEVIRLPRYMSWFNGPLAKMIAFFRCKKSAEAYRKIWSDRGSPLKYITEDQAEALGKRLPRGWRIFYAMRYGNPSIDAVLSEIEKAELDELVVIPMYPHFSGPTTRTAIHEFYRCLPSHQISANIRVCNDWHDDAGYIEAQSHLIHDYAVANGLDPENSVLMFSTHSMPESYIRNGDPYQEHILKSVELIAERLGWPTDRLRVSYQSKLGPAKWITPSTQDVLADLAEEGEKRVLVVPISFMADCIETLEEISIGYRREFEHDGRKMILCPALNDYPLFVDCLRNLALRGPHPVHAPGKSEAKKKVATLFEMRRAVPSQEKRIAGLVMVGVSRAGRLPVPEDMAVTYVEDMDAFRATKIAQENMPPMLRKLQKDFGFREIFAWNTCCRTEFYGWFDEDDNAVSDEAVADRLHDLAKHVFGDHEADVATNVLRGADAWRHLLRTACGLNSRLPAETDVLDQLETSRRIAEHAGTADGLIDALMGDVMKYHHDLVTENRFGKWAESYGAAALRLIAHENNLDYTKLTKIAAVGGSTTSRSLLHALRKRFAVDDKHLALVYRGCNHGSRMKLLRKAVGKGRRVHVNEYTDPDAGQAMAEADLIVFGLDRSEPVLTKSQVEGWRDFASRPVIMIDFNTMGSIEREIGEIPGVTLIDAEEIERLVNRHADNLMNDEEFRKVVNDVEGLIRQEAGSAAGRSSNDLQNAVKSSRHEDNDDVLPCVMNADTTAIPVYATVK